MYGNNVVVEFPVGAGIGQDPVQDAEAVALTPIAASVGLMVLVTVPAGAMVVRGATSLSTAAGVAVTPGTVALKVTP